VSGEAVRGGFEGKIGLGLSGGGFRASLFHIGVLARLAELDVLRRVEVISCVSGGSIVGAHYYLEVQELLRRKRDEEITAEDYVEIVRRLERHFLAGVQRNIRMRVAASFKAALKLVFKPGYTRTLRLGELYEEELYSRVEDRAGDEKQRPRYMHELMIRPRLGDAEWWEDFRPKLHNWRRATKAPILVLNAASLNTGHNWQFTAAYMGESPAAIHGEIDTVYRLRRKFYTDGPDSEADPQQVRLGTAVAASSCVPALFEPIVFDGAYERRDVGSTRTVNVRLVDGGVCDNQGVASLLEQDCNVLLVSDGSGQLEPSDSPGTTALPVAGRSNDVLQARIRGTQYDELDARRRSSLLRGLMFVHLKKDLENSPVDWKDCPAELRLAPPEVNEDMTGYGVPKEVQKRLARIRTDLDTFCDAEAYALMTSGYLMTEAEYPKASATAAHNAARWNFLRIDEVMKNTDNAYAGQRRRLEEILDAGASLAFKVWKLAPGLKVLTRVLTWLAVLLGVCVVGGFVALAVYLRFNPAWWETNLVSPDWLRRAGAFLTLGFLVNSLLALALAALLVNFVGRRALGVSSWLDTLARKAVAVVLLLVGYPAAKIHLWLFDPKYKECGGAESIIGPAARAGD
jgi:predicted acylesterase/phospholipase RssA